MKKFATVNGLTVRKKTNSFSEARAKSLFESTNPNIIARGKFTCGGNLECPFRADFTHGVKRRKYVVKELHFSQRHPEHEFLMRPIVVDSRIIVKYEA